jgi:GNAT superfamily N-acetyltransferase
MDANVIDDLSSPQLLPALEANMVEFWSIYGRADGCEIYEGDDLVRVLTGIPEAIFNGAYRPRLDASRVEQVIDDTQRALQRWHAPMLWWLGPDIQPADLGERLESSGAEHAGLTPGMAVDLFELSADLHVPKNFTCKLVEGEEDIETWAEVAAKGTGFSTQAQQALIEVDRKVGLFSDGCYRRYIGYEQGEPVASSAMVLHSGVAGIYAVATLPEARRKGIGDAMTRIPLLAARQQGYHIGTLQASAMGRPVYQRMGFHDVCGFNLYFMQAS